MPQHRLEALWHRIADVAPYPPGVMPVPQPIPGTAFFPGGYGLWRPDPSKPLPPLPDGGILVLGQDFQSESGYRAALARGSEIPGVQTWATLTKLLSEARLNPSSCFFTNVYMGLRAGSSATGDFPGLGDPAYINRCLDFLNIQFRVLRPRLIVTLGRPAFEAVGIISRDLTDWTTCGGFKGLDQAGPVRKAAFLDGADRIEAIVVALLHPSLRDSNIKYRSWQGLKGHKAEMAMLTSALAQASLLVA